MTKKLLLIAGLAVTLSLAVAGSAQAWTEEDCPTPETHEDCLQFFPSPTPEVSPTPKGDGPTGNTPAQVREAVNNGTLTGAGVGGGSGQ